MDDEVVVIDLSTYWQCTSCTIWLPPTSTVCPFEELHVGGDPVALTCPECGEEVESERPENFIVPGVDPLHRHVSDKTALCPVVTAQGYRPAEPVEHIKAGA